MSTSNTLPIGSILHGGNYYYKIEEVLGQGSFGITYKASVCLAGSLGRIQSDVFVAVKEFFMRDINTRQGTSVGTGSDSSLYHNYRKDFIREANNISKLNCPHIVKVMEAFEENNTAYFVMEYIDDGSLDRYIQSNNGLDEREALNNVLQISDALSCMHNNMMLHLDLKPLNIMRRANGELVLIDFGLSKQFNSEGEPESSTRIGNGTMGYAPIEQACYRREDGFSPTLDIYALGATLYKMLMGIAPPDASTVLNNGFPETAMKNRGISQNVIKLISWIMEPVKRMRPQSISDVVAEVNRILPGCSDIHRERQNIQEEATIVGQNNLSSASEICNGFQVRWSEDVSESMKSLIRELLNNMKKIGEKKRTVSSENESDSFSVLPIMSLGDKTYDYLHGLTTGENSRRCIPLMPLGTILNAIYNLSVWTSLPFRLCDENELQFERSACPEYWETLRTVCWSGGRLMCKTYCGNAGFTEINLSKDAQSEFDAQFVCEGIKPVCNRQGGYDSPLGFGLYKVCRDKLWNITTPEQPMQDMLPEKYDGITHIGIWKMPGGGHGNDFDFFGLKAVKGDYTYYYSFESGKFKLLNNLSEKQTEKNIDAAPAIYDWGWRVGVVMIFITMLLAIICASN